jgi:predicted alpha/beta superfamily hydrolase
MKEIKRFQVRGIPGAVTRADFSGRIVDFWAPDGGSDHVLIAHDGQNIFDRKTATFIYTWLLAQTAIRVARESGKQAPLVIGVFHSSTKNNPHGRAKDLCPEDPFREGVQPATSPLLNIEQLHSNAYLEKIFGEITPEIALRTHSNYLPARTAMIGSSMGGLATLYAAIKHPDSFRTALALSPHWPLAENALVDWIIPKIPQTNDFKVWMSRGTKGLDSSYKPFQDRADQLMLNLNWSSHNFKSKVFHRTSHNERSWARYVDEPLKFWLG